MKTLVLTINTGGGHNESAKAVCDYLEPKGVECKLVDAYEYISPILNEMISKGYLLSTKIVPELYGGFYRMAEKKKIKEEPALLSKTINSVLSFKIEKIIEEFKPDVIINTHIFASQIISTLARRGMFPAKTIGIITDFTVHPFWEDTNLDYYVTPTHLLAHQLERKGISREKMLPFGIPIKPKFASSVSKEEAREKLGLTNMWTILIMMGSMGYANITKDVKILDRLPYDIQIVCICGSNKKQKESLEKIKFQKPVYTFGYVDNVDVFMDSADCIVTKPGGMTTSELFAKGLPAIITNPIPGQEKRNTEFLLNNGLAMKLSSTFMIDEAIDILMQNPKRMEALKTNSKAFGKPYAVTELGNFIMKLGEVSYDNV